LPRRAESQDPVDVGIGVTRSIVIAGDDGIIAQRRDGFQGHVAGAQDRPFVVLLEQDRADQANDGILIGEDADDFRSPLDLAVEALDRVGRVQLGAVLRRKAHIGEHVGLGFIHEDGKLGQFGPEPVGNLAPLSPGGFGIVLGKSGGNEGGDDAPAALAGHGPGRCA